jgi:hypothetical protein
VLTALIYRFIGGFQGEGDVYPDPIVSPAASHFPLRKKGKNKSKQLA